jgi:hypothetical protein
MVLRSPSEWKEASRKLSEELAQGVPLGDALRNLNRDYAAMELKLAVQEACGLSSTEAAQVITREVMASRLP